ncbi:MAG: hypothetical protein LBQ60_04135 [Bacteroidales bacterium]|jgi:hypothetical protein|nr:hypothetical protein [Bacteroidales bacterium]
MMHQPTPEEIKARIEKKKKQRKYNLPVIGHFADRSVLFKSIIQAYEATGIHYTLIFEACIGKIYKAGNVVWEYQKGNHYIKYKAYYINVQDKYTRFSSFN